tara:strand:+ start:407 stop:664 length:258 start_codon:yes stop_codon:yes gene_type:complete
MKVYIFGSHKSSMQNEIFGFTEDAQGLNLPEESGPWKFIRETTMNRGEGPRIGENTEKILNDIENVGYCISGASIVREITETDTK